MFRYKRFGDDLLHLELVNAVTAEPAQENIASSKSDARTVQEALEQAEPELRDLYESLKETLVSLGDDVQLKELKVYFAFKRIQNFACVEVQTWKGSLLVYVKVDPDKIELEEGFTRDVRNIGHFGTGGLEITIRSPADIEKARRFFEMSYDVS